MGRAERIELTTSRATIWRSNQLSYARHILVRLKRFELLTHGLEGRCSIQLSYRRIRRSSKKKVERVMGIEPTRPAWKAGILPLNYTRIHRTSPSYRQRLYIIALLNQIVKSFFALFGKKFKIFFTIPFFGCREKKVCENNKNNGFVFLLYFKKMCYNIFKLSD